MAKQPIDVGAKFTADASGFQKAAANVGKSAKEIKANVRDTAGVFTELGGAIGGIGGDISGMISQLATATGPIALLSAVVGGVALAWKRSQENVELYLKSADKVKFGFAGYNVDAETARVDARRRASGQIDTGRASLTEANRILAYKGSTEAEKEMAKVMKEEAILMIQSGMALRSQVMGIKDKISWTLQYNKLLQEQETLNDASLQNQVRWEEMEAQLIKQRTIIQDKDTKAKDKAIAIVEAEKIANVLLKEKNAFIDQQLINTNALAEMTGTQEVVENRIWELQKQKATNLKEYGADMLKVLRMESRISKEVEKQVILRQQGPAKVGTNNINLPSFADGISMAGLQRPSVEIKSMADSLETVIQMTSILQNSFEQLFYNTGNGFKGMVESIINSIKMLVAELAAKAVILSILKFITGGVAPVSIGNIKMPSIGTKAPNILAPSPMGASSQKLFAVIKGRDIYLSNQRYGQMLSANT